MYIGISSDKFYEMTFYEIGQIFYVYNKKQKDANMKELRNMYINAQLQSISISCAIGGKEYPAFEELFGDFMLENCSEEELQIKEAEKLDKIFGLYASVVNASRKDAGK